MEKVTISCNFTTPTLHRMQKQIFWLLILTVLPGMLSAQYDSTMSRKQLRKNRPTYVLTGLGVGSANFRDFATSPLTYRGPAVQASLGRLKEDQQVSAYGAMNLLYAATGIRVDNERAYSTFVAWAFNYSRIYTIPSWSNENWQLATGGLLDLTTILRVNPSLQNNSFGMELFGSLFGSFQVRRDISRKRTKTFQFLFIHHTFRPKQRYLSYRVNLGLMNNYFRNGYSYSNQSAVVNDPSVFEDYEWSNFAGFRVRTSLAYTRVLNNGNAIRWAYEWQATTTSSSTHAFEMAQHVVKCSLLFNTK